MQQSKVFIANYKPETTEEQIQEFLASAGSVRRVQLMTDQHSGKSRGFGFVEFAMAAVDLFDGGILDGRKIAIQPAKDKAPKQQ